MLRADGDAEGNTVGLDDGDTVGLDDGAAEGFRDGSVEGAGVGLAVGSRVGVLDGRFGVGLGLGGAVWPVQKSSSAPAEAEHCVEFRGKVVSSRVAQSMDESNCAPKRSHVKLTVRGKGDD